MSPQDDGQSLTAILKQLRHLRAVSSNVNRRANVAAEMLHEILRRQGESALLQWRTAREKELSV